MNAVSLHVKLLFFVRSLNFNHFNQCITSNCKCIFSCINHFIKILDEKT